MNLPKTIEEYEDIWDSISPDYAEELSKSWDVIYVNWIQFLMKYFLLIETIEIGTTYLNDQIASCAEFNWYENEKKLIILLDSSNHYHIQFNIHNDDYDLLEFRMKLKDDDVALIPEGLRNCLLEAKNTDTPQTFEPNRIKSH